jgi:hypothetical protein
MIRAADNEHVAADVRMFVLRDRAADHADITLDAPMSLDEHVAAESHHAMFNPPAHDDVAPHPKHVLRILALDDPRHRIVLGHANGRRTRRHRDHRAQQRAEQRDRPRERARGGERQGWLRDKGSHICYRACGCDRAN